MRRRRSGHHLPLRARRSASILVGAAAVSGVIAPTVSAANVAPNRGFEDTCGASTTACFWPDSADSFVAQQRDPTIAKTGAASYRQALFGIARGRLTSSECVETPLAAGQVTVGFSYRLVAGTNVSQVRVRAVPWSSARCTGSASTMPQASTAAVNDGAWHDVSSTSPLPAATRSVSIEIAYDCSTSCPNTQVNYDDLILEQAAPPTSVTLAALAAGRGASGARLRWRTTFEAKTLGFNIYREFHGRLVKLNRAVIPSVFGGTASGHAYSWLDRAVPSRGAVRYRLQAVSLDGQRSWAGSALAAG